MTGSSVTEDTAMQRMLYTFTSLGGYEICLTVTNWPTVKTLIAEASS